ncbi:MAG: LLM class F420-dependent oxidoreductase [Actinobacteria bacterium]|jgi:probable F420-dependent oxidoreductase|uniref:Luciferase-like domain-containing protein n=1 Tax=marine metagenome TaxID=408172 RepID=A0A381QN36_9ZZZZ|nr:LLM class F420-dependent oxidoreductase [Actinomycetota bacterium]MCS5689061.1 LLM class F420-dependent oxidoreductase [Acidimicrobiales bacterium]MEC8921822.1 LLM class F420-dependent oxidoreductase [Actinomycetota bacterium]MEC9315928.1 LLM class F420-dependent oxidoreductase [Actinomycetota bacterium]MED5552843.1 LLM class F420-dependent oxidoreductase [Actinomycetota bacterium]|tara:strand:- start:84 stop:1052 length:969 start_codon:yes stop_codon:yes gene_type:complete
MTNRYGITVPFDAPLNEQADLYKEFTDLGYTDLWSSEADGTDGFTPLILASQWAPTLRLGIAIIPAYTRGPALMAQHIASMCEAAPGRFVMGIGSSSNVIVENWNGIPFEEPYKRTRDTVRFLRKALTGEKVSEQYDGFEVNGFTLRRVPQEQPPILIAALRSGMLRLAGQEGDGAIINWLSAEDVATVKPYVEEGGAQKEIVARIFCCPNPDIEIVRAGAKRAIAAYLNVPVYADFHRWLGRSEELEGMWTYWASGDRKAALDAIPDQVVDQLIVHGTPEQCREHIDRYHAMGVTTSAISIMPFGDIDPVQAARDLAPAAR